MVDRLPDAAVAWVLALVGGEEITSIHAAPLHGGAVATVVERLDVALRLPDRSSTRVRLVRKRGFPFEVAALEAAQTVRHEAPAIPELISSGSDERGWWMITPYYEGSSPGADAVPPVVFESLASLHSHGRSNSPDTVPVITPAWWRHLCLEYNLPAVRRRAESDPLPELAAAVRLLERAAEHPAIPPVLDRLPRTLIHNDVHPGNILVNGADAVLIDWGSTRVGPAMVDLANLLRRESPQFATYVRRWRAINGKDLASAVVDLGYLWADLQIPVQYLAWVVTTLPAPAIADAVGRAERALAALEAL